ncbi:MAG: DoxX family membrane protein [Phycisphaerae bacterium]|nr:DoxX family membrane protein [Phycisphaerae bacterium]
MKLSQRIALAWTPLCLRLALGVTFLWAGGGKVVEFIEVQGQSAATLANMGVALAPAPAHTPPPAPVPQPTNGAPKPAGPDRPLPPTDAEPAKKEPEKPAGAKAAPKPGTKRAQPAHPDNGASTPALPADAPPSGSGKGKVVPVSRPRTTTAALDEPPTPPGIVPADAPTGPIPAAKAQTAPAGGSGGPTGSARTAADFPEPVRVRRLYGLALLLHSAANPAPSPDGKPRMPLWPPQAVTGSLPVYFAWAAALTELVGGGLVLVGLLTRLSALAQAGVMAVALWLTQIGPAVQSGRTLLGFLPDRPPFSVEGWMPVLWIFALLMAALALFFSGPGVAALDQVIFGGGGSRSGGGGGGGGGGGKPTGSPIPKVG